MARTSDISEGESLEPAYVGGVGGAFPTSNANGVAAVDKIPRTKIDCLVSPTRGLISCPTAPPTGLAIARIIVAVVRPFKPNHVSEYFGPRT